MKLFKLLKGVRCRVLGRMSIEIEGLYISDKGVLSGGLYFCLNGRSYNGEQFVLSAIEKGVVAIVAEKEFQGLHGITQILVKDARKAMSLIAANYYNNPAKDLKLIGVTGTNGKTTTTHMISDMLNGLGYSTAIIGTNGVLYKDKKIETGMTTPDPIELQKILYKLKKENIEYVCMEVSAHSTYYHKLEGLRFEIIIFSNLTEDHLDFFETMENYWNAKKMIFDKKYTKQALINIDDVYGQRIYDSINISKKTYAINSESDYKAIDFGMNNYIQKIKICNEIIESKFLGAFNIYNLTAAIACLKMLNIEYFNLQETVKMIKLVPGRFNTIVIKQKLYIVDYAHTPDGLYNVLKLCKNISNKNKLICVFGCGGDRETQKRSKMGEISSNIADFTIITTDNPRFENRLKIAQDIASGMTCERYKIILDRSDAIKYSDKISKEGDVILVAGKGAEDYIDEMGVKKFYSDYKVIESLKD